MTFHGNSINASAAQCFCSVILFSVGLFFSTHFSFFPVTKHFHLLFVVIPSFLIGIFFSSLHFVISHTRNFVFICFHISSVSVYSAFLSAFTTQVESNRIYNIHEIICCCLCVHCVFNFNATGRLWCGESKLFFTFHLHLLWGVIQRYENHLSLRQLFTVKTKNDALRRWDAAEKLSHES